MTWWVLNYLDNQRSWNYLYTLASTTVPDHLTMAWSHHKPSRHGVYRVIRGKTVLCGYEYHWDSPILNPQIEAGDTSWHTFMINFLRSDQHVWYYLFAPDGPYGLEIQGPLVHIPPPETYLWTSRIYVGTHLKGIFYSDTFTGPGGDDPVWQTRSGGLFSLKIWQLEPDPLGPQHRMYCIAGDPGDRQVYRSEPPVGQQWVPILTNPEAVAITGSTSGTICWVATNIYHPGHVYVLFNSALTDNGTWCIRSINYGHTWSAFQIHAYITNYEAGNLMAGFAQGSSPYEPGPILYAAICDAATDGVVVYFSADSGETWFRRTGIGASSQTPRCLVDPTDHSIVYLGPFVNAPNPHELYRSETHGANPVEADGALHLGPMIHPSEGSLWVHPTDHHTLIVLQDERLYTSEDYAATWIDHLQIAKPSARLAINWEQPAHLYLARSDAAPPPPDPVGQHVIFVSQTWGAAMQGKAGANCALPDGGGDSIPYNCGGVCLQGITLFPPD